MIFWNGNYEFSDLKCISDLAKGVGVVSIVCYLDPETKSTRAAVASLGLCVNTVKIEIYW